MSVERTSTSAEVNYRVVGEAAMRGFRNGAGVDMVPHTAKVTLVNDELCDVYVWGSVVNARGSVLKAQAFAPFSRDDLADAPEWVRKIFVKAVFSGTP